MSDMPEADFDWANGFEARCPSCGVEHELVRPGKTQPRCLCHEHEATIAERDATIRDLQAKMGWMPVSEFKDEHCRKPCWTWGPKRVAPTIALGDFADGLWFHEVRSGTAPWSHWSDIDEDEPLIDNDGFSSITHFMLLSIPPPPVPDEGK